MESVAQPGKASLPHAAKILERKTLPTYNIVVGEDRASIRLLERYLGVEVSRVERVTEGTLGALVQVYARHRIDLSPEQLKRVSIWAAEPITKGSAALHILIKQAASLLGVPVRELTEEVVREISYRIVRGPIEEAPSLLAAAMWELTAPVLPRCYWAEPWEKPLAWIPEGVSITYRLNTLYRSIAGYCFAQVHNDAALAFGVSQKRIDIASKKRLDTTRLYHSFSMLSRWHSGHIGPWVCAFLISSLWVDSRPIPGLE